MLTSAKSPRAQQLKTRPHKILNGMDYSFRVVVVEAQKTRHPKATLIQTKRLSPKSNFLHLKYVGRK